MVIFPGCSQNKKTVVYLCACVLTPSLSAVSHSSHGTRTTTKKFYLPPRFFSVENFPSSGQDCRIIERSHLYLHDFFHINTFASLPFVQILRIWSFFFFTQFFFFLPHHLILTPLPVFGSRLSPSLKKKI